MQTSKYSDKTSKYENIEAGIGKDNTGVAIGIINSKERNFLRWFMKIFLES